MTQEETKDIRAKILAGIELSYNRLLESLQKEDGELVISKNNKIEFIKARTLKKTHVFSSDLSK